MKKLFLFCAICTVLCSAPALAQVDRRTFETGKPIVTAQSIVCFELNASRTIAKILDVMDALPVRQILSTGDCLILNGMLTYVREVVKEGDWRVWEVKMKNGLTLYETTNWTPAGTEM